MTYMSYMRVRLLERCLRRRVDLSISCFKQGTFVVLDEIVVSL